MRIRLGELRRVIREATNAHDKSDLARRALAGDNDSFQVLGDILEDDAAADVDQIRSPMFVERLRSVLRALGGVKFKHGSEDLNVDVRGGGLPFTSISISYSNREFRLTLDDGTEVMFDIDDPVNGRTYVKFADPSEGLVTSRAKTNAIDHMDDVRRTWTRIDKSGDPKSVRSRDFYEHNYEDASEFTDDVKRIQDVLQKYKHYIDRAQGIYETILRGLGGEHWAGYE
jgi:hypothetical protein